MANSTAVILFSVSVPVLSEQMAETRDFFRQQRRDFLLLGMFLGGVHRRLSVTAFVEAGFTSGATLLWKNVWPTRRATNISSSSDSGHAGQDTLHVGAQDPEIFPGF